jgi:hypothetical protein
MLFDEGQGTAVVLQLFDSAEDMRTGGEAFAAMDPGETPGKRVSVDMCELSSSAGCNKPAVPADPRIPRGRPAAARHWRASSVAPVRRPGWSPGDREPYRSAHAVCGFRIPSSGRRRRPRGAVHGHLQHPHGAGQPCEGAKLTFVHLTT